MEREDQNRISVGSLPDWLRVKNNLNSAAFDKLIDMIEAEGLQDERDALLAHFSHFMNSTFTMAQLNLRVNGHNFDSIDDAAQDMEAFDEALDRRIWSLADTRLQWHKRTAKTRREVPAEIQSRVASLFNKGQTQDQTISQAHDPMSEDEEPVDESAPVPLEVVEEFQMTSAITQELDQNMTSQQERVQRAERATNQLRSLKY